MEATMSCKIEAHQRIYRFIEKECGRMCGSHFQTSSRLSKKHRANVHSRVRCRLLFFRGILLPISYFHDCLCMWCEHKWLRKCCVVLCCVNRKTHRPKQYEPKNIKTKYIFNNQSTRSDSNNQSTIHLCISNYGTCCDGGSQMNIVDKMSISQTKSHFPSFAATTTIITSLFHR